MQWNCFLLIFKVGISCHMNTILRLKFDWLSFPNILKSLSQIRCDLFLGHARINESFSGADLGILKRVGGGSLYVSHHGWVTKKILDCRWSKKIKITLQTITFCRNISISICEFSQFLHTMKACQCNLINFSKFTNAFIRKEEKHTYSSQLEKKNWEKLDFLSWLRFFRLFYKVL